MSSRDQDQAQGGLRRLFEEESAQATVEYAAISFWLTVGFFLFGRPLWIALIQALQVYFDSYYLVLRMPIP